MALFEIFSFLLTELLLEHVPDSVEHAISTLIEPGDVIVKFLLIEVLLLMLACFLELFHLFAQEFGRLYLLLQLAITHTAVKIFLKGRC